MHLIPDKKAAY